MSYYGNILDNPLIVIPTDVEELAQLIYTHSYDWSVTLDFFVRVAQSRGIILDSVSISEEIRKLIGEE